MSLTAREWLLLPEADQKRRAGEVSPEECFKLRMELSEIHFTEEQKMNMSEEEKHKFTHPRESTKEEKEEFNRKAQAIFDEMIEESKKKKNEAVNN